MGSFNLRMYKEITEYITENQRMLYFWMLRLCGQVQLQTRQTHLLDQQHRQCHKIKWAELDVQRNV